MIAIYSDGSITKNPGGTGGWAFVAYLLDGTTHEASGSEPETTSNRMELRAIIEAVRWLHKTSPGVGAVIYSDSRWAVFGAVGFNRRHANLDLWDELNAVHGAAADAGAIIEIEWIRGHNGTEGNERADVLAGLAARAPSSVVD